MGGADGCKGGGGHYSVTFIFSEQCLESKNATKRSWKLIHFHHGKSWKSHGILFLNLCGNPGGGGKLTQAVVINLCLA